MHETFVRIEGEPFLSRAQAYRDALFAWHAVWSEYAKSIGADAIGGGLHSFSFKKGQPPAGWTKPTGSERMSHPKKGHPDEAVIDCLRRDHPRPKSADVFGAAVVLNLSWKRADGSSGSHGLGGMGTVLNGPWVGWAGDAFLGHIPDAAAAVRAHLTEHPNDIIAEPAGSWKMPSGLTPITEAEYELILAQHKVAEERKSAA
ncbi:hypothetical protein [Methylobacterium sp. Gmos1]